jgi:hypothetical protein
MQLKINSNSGLQNEKYQQVDSSIGDYSSNRATG